MCWICSSIRLLMQSDDTKLYHAHSCDIISALGHSSQLKFLHTSAGGHEAISYTTVTQP